MFVFAHYRIPLPRLSALYLTDKAEDTGSLQTYTGSYGLIFDFHSCDFLQKCYHL